MPPALPTFRGPGRVLPWALASALELGAACAWALEVRVEEVVENGGYLWMGARLEEVLPARVRSGVARGMPATLTVHVELWRRRSLWFDRLESSWDIEQRARYDVWGESFRLERRGAPAVVISSLDSLEAVLERPFRLRLGPTSALRPEQRYYVSLVARLKPLTVDDAREIEGWLSGEVEEKRQAGLGGVTRLPLAVFDAVRNAVGLGDVSARSQSADFTAEDLREQAAP